MRITVNKRPVEILIGHCASVEQWDQARGKTKSKGRVANETNLYVEAVRAKIFSIH